MGCPIKLLDTPAFMWSGDGLEVSLSMALLLVGKEPNCAMFKAGRRKGETLLLCKEGRLFAGLSLIGND